MIITREVCDICLFHDRSIDAVHFERFSSNDSWFKIGKMIICPSCAGTTLRFAAFLDIEELKRMSKEKMAAFANMKGDLE